MSPASSGQRLGMLLNSLQNTEQTLQQKLPSVSPARLRKPALEPGSMRAEISVCFVHLS